MATDTTGVNSTYEESRADALQYLNSVKDGIRERTLTANVQGLIGTLRDWVIPYLTQNELVSLESCLDNAVDTLRNGTRKVSPSSFSNSNGAWSNKGYMQRRQESYKPKEIVEQPANPELARTYAQIASYVSHEVFERMHPR